jgi:tripartite ATP-independent transporter DctM subunit
MAVAFYFVAVAIVVKRNPDVAPLGEQADWGERRRVTMQSWAVVLLAFVVSGGIYSGVFTVSEAASVGATVALLLAIFRKRLTRPKFLAALGDTASNTGLIFVIIIGASVFSYFAALSGLPSATVDWIEGLGLPPYMVIACLMIFYLILGSIFDTIAAMVLTLPFVYPLVIGMGYDPIWWGVINIVVIELGMITPPIGINVYVLHGMAKNLPLRTIFRGVIPFVFADLARLIVLILFPALSLWLPGVLGWL